MSDDNPPPVDPPPPGWPDPEPPFDQPLAGAAPGSTWEAAGQLSTDAFGRPLAPWWRRAVAVILDGLIFGIPFTLLLVVLDLDDELVGNALSLAGGIAYFGLLNGSEQGQTVGKRLLGIRVRDSRTGGPLGTGPGVLRAVVYDALFLACILPGIVNVLSPLWDKRRQAWHDKAVSSVVITATDAR